jgi:hypothetical protein
MAAAYPAEPFKQADSLLTGMIESYRGSTDAADMLDIQSLLETTVKIAKDREYRVHNNIKGVQLHNKHFSNDCSSVSLLSRAECVSLHVRSRVGATCGSAVVRWVSAGACLTTSDTSCRAELSQKVTGLEAAAVYSDAKAGHEQRMTEINASIAEVQQEVQRVNSDIR